MDHRPLKAGGGVMTAVWVITQEGVYRHAIGGVFTTIEQARDAALSHIRAEPDDYHWWGISRYTLDHPTSDLDEFVESYRRKDDEVWWWSFPGVPSEASDAVKVVGE
jgi:hypothetical protein